MLVFKARRRVSPALRAENTPSEKRVIQNLVKARREVESWIERNLTSVMDAIAHRPWTTVADMIPDEPWYEFQEYLQDELTAEAIDAGFRAVDGPVGKAKTPLLGYSFDATRPEAAEWAAREAGELVTEIGQGQRLLIRDLISRGQTQGITVDQTARTIRQTVGLTTQQAGWVDNFYYRAVNDAMRSGLSLTQAEARARTQTARYHDRIHRYRAMTIARTEVARAASMGRQIAWNQGIAQGFISPQAQKEWIAEVDACEICAPRNGTRHPVGQPWPDGEPPAHPNCRCDLLLIPEPIADISGAELDVAGLQPPSAAGLLGDALEVRGKITPEMQQRLDDLAKLPAEVADRLRENGGRVSVFDGPITNHPDMAHLKGVQPRDWPAGKTWDDVGGAQMEGRVYIGYTGESGSASTALHETGHAIDYYARSGTYGMSGDPRFRAVYLRARSHLVDPYYQQAGDAGPQETFAEAVAYLYSGRGTRWNLNNPEIKELLAVTRELVEAG